ncbi:MAG: glycosyltransferase family 39 protein [Acidimicrobiales bacterium]|nr:glycosyltransferase family 39 protein [Acidimicrobiales bacterium]
MRTTRGTDVATSRRSSPPVVLVAVAVGVVLAAGLVLRFLTRSPLWLDEALSVNIARLPLGDIPEALRRDGHPPLYYVLLHGWSAMVGGGDAAVRAFSGLAAVACLPLAWLAGRRLGGTSAAWATTILLASSPYAIRYATEVRMYALVMALVLAGYLLLGACLERSTWPRLAGLAVVAGSLLLTHYWSAYLLAAVGLVLLGRARRPGSRRASLRALAAMAVGAALMILPWLPSFWSQAQNTGTPWAGPMRPTAVLMVTVVDFGGGPDSEGQLLGVVVVVLVLLALFGRAVDRRTIEVDLRTVPQVRTELAVVATTLVLAVVAAYVTSSAYASRYAAVVFPLVVLAAGVGVTRFRAPWVRVAVLAVAATFGLLGGYRNVVDDRTQGGDVVAAIDAGAAAGDVVAYCPDQLGPAFSRGLRDDVAALAYPTGDAPGLVDWREYAARNEAADPAAFADELLQLAGPDNAVWLVWQGGYRTFGDDCEALFRALAAGKPTVETVVAADGEVFEPATLTRFSGP